MWQVNEEAEQQQQTRLQKAVVTERLAGLRVQQEHLVAALEQAEAAASAVVAPLSATALVVDPSATAQHRKAAAVKAAALLVEDDGLEDELNVSKGARRGGASAGGFVETERDRLIRTVCTDRAWHNCRVRVLGRLNTLVESLTALTSSACERL